MTRRILVTAALPYANSDIHLGHLSEHVLADVFARFQRLRGHEVLHVCGDDTHGTAIMLRAANEGRSEPDLIAEVRRRHVEDFATFQIAFDHYSGTHTDANRALCGSSDFVNHLGVSCRRRLLRACGSIPCGSGRRCSTVRRS